MIEHIITVIDSATDDLTEALADLDAKISFDEPEAYACMHGHVIRAQTKLLTLMKNLKMEVEPQK